VVEGKNEQEVVSEEGGDVSEEAKGDALQEKEDVMKKGALCGGWRVVVLGKKKIDSRDKRVGWMSYVLKRI
jgi:hypothetical protein